MVKTSGILLFFVSLVFAQGLPDYYTQYYFLSAPPGSFQQGMAGFVNPANSYHLKDFEGRFAWSTDGPKTASIHEWGIFGGYQGLGFGMLKHKAPGYKIVDYSLSAAFGTDGWAYGLSYDWSSGDVDYFKKERFLRAGTIVRPNRYLSIGATGFFSLKSNLKQGAAELALRPLGTPSLTLFADGFMHSEKDFKDAQWSAGAAVQALKGVFLVGRYFDTKAFTVGLSLDLGRAGVSVVSFQDKEYNHRFDTYQVRFGGTRPSFSHSLAKDTGYLSLPMKGHVDYLNYMIVDKSMHCFYDLIKNIDAAAQDKRINVIVLNLSSLRILPEHAWEMREALKRAQGAGKKVVIFIDFVQMTLYHLASVADVLVMDPEGFMMLNGYVMGKTYMKGTLEKLGLGFDEWRFFKYKSAAEVLSRENFSDADREQYQDYVDDRYELFIKDVNESRGFKDNKVEDLINDMALFDANNSLEAGLVDTLARWSAKEEVLKKITGRTLNRIGARELLPNALLPQKWGNKPTIALVYGLGVCDMDAGIRARWLEKKFLELERDNSIKAVVFRVDSPGGDGMASDMVAEALKKCSEKKPVIVSQGQVAGSGGYWISMYGDEIVAAPNTITGSIGVIGGWLWDKGLSDKMGMTSDYVKRGDHAEVEFGITLPLLGIQIPARNLTEEERAKIEIFIKAAYDGFVKKVAKGRGMPEEKIREIAEGHFYSGVDGKQNGLVDEIGGLFTALAIARQKAKIKPDDEVNIVQVPKTKGFMPPVLPSLEIQTHHPIFEYVRKLAENPGKPLPMMYPGTWPTIEE
ncbi:signal peptide peptidase SppA [candidate division KSB1 bacterium]|nr:signal peptide peptidase SppA [candidate division KSB1 bacterium]